ncbi:MAG: cytochrome c family protein, partial [Ignavibacteria bacterium]|nr:cytochrome c family protein [Ignavibacteria bacterium]
MDSTDLYFPVKFSHRWHAEMSGMSGGCALCHHYNPPGEILPCSNCHSEVRGRTSSGRPDLRSAYHQQCMQCHRAWSHEVNCTNCHASRSIAGTEAGEREHAEYASRKHPPVTVPAKIVFDTPAEGERATFYHDEHVALFGLECIQCHSAETCIRCHDRQKSSQRAVKSSDGEHAACRQCHD